MKDNLGREVITPDGKAPSVPNLPVKIVTSTGLKDGWMNGGTAVDSKK